MMVFFFIIIHIFAIFALKRNIVFSYPLLYRVPQEKQNKKTGPTNTVRPYKFG